MIPFHSKARGRLFFVCPEGIYNTPASKHRLAEAKVSPARAYIRISNGLNSLHARTDVQPTAKIDSIIIQREFCTSALLPPQNMHKKNHHATRLITLQTVPAARLYAAHRHKYLQRLARSPYVQYHCAQVNSCACAALCAQVGSACVPYTGHDFRGIRRWSAASCVARNLLSVSVKFTYKGILRVYLRAALLLCMRVYVREFMRISSLGVAHTMCGKGIGRARLRAVRETSQPWQFRLY